MTTASFHNPKNAHDGCRQPRAESEARARSSTSRVGANINVIFFPELYGCGQSEVGSDGLTHTSACRVCRSAPQVKLAVIIRGYQ